MVQRHRHRIGQAGCLGGVGGHGRVAGKRELRGEKQFTVELPRIHAGSGSRVEARQHG